MTSAAATDLEASADAGEVVIMSWVPAERIDPRHRAYVERCAKHAARELGLGPIRVRYFGPRTGIGDFWGLAPEPDVIPGGVAPDDLPMTIGILYSLRGDAVRHVVRHEVAHVAQLIERGTYHVPRRVVAAGMRDDELIVATVPIVHPAGPDGEADADRFAYLEDGAA